ncbi:hypothetical protein [Chitinophaga sp. Cy-1792]|uniref:hypothetical protein n=1 Tax=Chitinophaga sp. Cy-1792 TaxID=2608339 RepID=UPI001422C4FF|nr:hypothetical protein [Chitinophaga sp. Cy-1792]NIG54789.1 hypothetical protein [Chitinophaga sp. Cy-1792]
MHSNETTIPHKKRRWQLLPVFTKVLVIPGTLAGTFITGSLLILIIKDRFWSWDAPFLLMLLTCLLYFMGFLFICLEKRYVIGWAYASSILGVLLSIGAGREISLYASTPLIIILTAVPFGGLHALLFVVLLRVRRNWKTIGASKSEMN